MDGWMEGGKEGGRDGRRDGWMDGCVHEYFYTQRTCLDCELFLNFRYSRHETDIYDWPIASSQIAQANLRDLPMAPNVSKNPAL